MDEIHVRIEEAKSKEDTFTTFDVCSTCFCWNHIRLSGRTFWIPDCKNFGMKCGSDKKWGPKTECPFALEHEFAKKFYVLNVTSDLDILTKKIEAGEWGIDSDQMVWNLHNLPTDKKTILKHFFKYMESDIVKNGTLEDLKKLLVDLSKERCNNIVGKLRLCKRIPKYPKPRRRKKP